MPVYHNLPSLVKPIWTQTPVTGCLTYLTLASDPTPTSESPLLAGTVSFLLAYWEQVLDDI